MRKLVYSDAITSSINSFISKMRGMYSSDTYGRADKEKRSIRNIVHVSDSQESAEREIKVWFTPSELFKYKNFFG